MMNYLTEQYDGKFRGGSIYFSTVVNIGNYLSSCDLDSDYRHKDVMNIFNRLRDIEEVARNPVAHTITNMTEEKLRKLQNKKGQNIGMSSRQILQQLHAIVKLVYGKSIKWDYDRLNAFIRQSLKEAVADKK